MDLAETLAPHLRAIWARMPPDAKARVQRLSTAGPVTPSQMIELWAAADRYERSGRAAADEAAAETAREEQEDVLDELMVERAAKGDWGTRAREAVEECLRQYTRGTTRRAFLRAARGAVQATRDWHPASRPRRHGMAA
jgi:hypothetical protein